MPYGNSMKTLLVLSFVLAAGVQAGSQTCHLKSGAGPLSQFTVNYEISHDAAALQHSSVVAVHSRHGDQGREATYLAAGENANLNLTVIALDEALVMASLSSHGRDFFRVEIEQSDDKYWGFAISTRADGHEEIALYDCGPFPAEIAAILAAGETNLVSDLRNGLE